MKGPEHGIITQVDAAPMDLKQIQYLDEVVIRTDNGGHLPSGDRKPRYLRAAFV